MSQRAPGFNTLAIHAGAKPDPATGARATPIYQTTSYVFDDADHAASLFGLKAFGNIYTRIMNPTQAVLEERVAALEGGTAALAVASGHAAQMLVFHTIMRPGDNFVAARRLYGGSINQFGQAFKSFGWDVRWADTRRYPNLQKGDRRQDARRCLSRAWPIPTVSLSIMKPIGKIARKHGMPLIVDNTLATPYLVRPIDMAPISSSIRDQVHWRPRQFDRRRDGGWRHVRLVEVGPLPDAVRAVPGIWRHKLCRNLRRFGFRHRVRACLACATSARLCRLSMPS